ncbi:hypothetical protein [Stenotrophomonas sp.]|uniref:hypothetical protein n=1 Tax=Stenotrophomonas sp. TaxID=69392 RepID=UPI0028AD1008|nr:hypothetical protein [Stenotrophomonas sp.]
MTAVLAGRSSLLAGSISRVRCAYPGYVAASASSSSVFKAVIPAQAGIALVLDFVLTSGKGKNKSDSRLRGNDGIKAKTKTKAKANPNPNPNPNPQSQSSILNPQHALK